jgi:uncharacterized protein
MNKHSAALFLTFFVAVPLESSLALEVPRLSQRVTDLANMIDPQTQNAIESQLSAHESLTSDQIAVLTIPSLEGDVIENYSMKVVETWKLGQAGKDNGVLLLIVRDDRKLRIEVGYGLEGKLTDVYSSRIIRDVMTPKLRMGDTSGAVLAGTTAIIGILGGDASIREQLDTSSSGSGSGESEELTWEDILILFGFIGFFILKNMIGGGMRSGRRYGGGFYSSSSSGGSSFSGGGGSFGGGGSSGSW